jgi:hypothetical protein
MWFDFEINYSENDSNVDPQWERGWEEGISGQVFVCCKDAVNCLVCNYRDGYEKGYAEYKKSLTSIKYPDEF